MKDTFRQKLESWAQKSLNWKTKGGYPNLHEEEIEGRKQFMKAIGPLPFLPWPTNPVFALATYDAIMALEKK